MIFTISEDGRAGGWETSRRVSAAII